MQNRSKPVKTHAWAVTLIFPLIILAIGTGFVCYYRGRDTGRREIGEKLCKMNEGCQDCMIEIRRMNFLDTTIYVQNRTITLTENGKTIFSDIPSKMPQELRDRVANGEFK